VGLPSGRAAEMLELGNGGTVMAAMTTDRVLTTGALAARFGLPAWQLRRVLDAHLSGRVLRLGLYRGLLAADVPELERVLRRLGLIHEGER